MWMLLILALGASDGGMRAAPVAPYVQAAPMSPGGGSWLPPASKSFGSLAGMWSTERPADPAPSEPALMRCTIRILKADPKLDAEIVRPAPLDLDPKIVRPSPCK